MKVWLSPVTQDLTRIQQQVFHAPIEEEFKVIEVREPDEVGP